MLTLYGIANCDTIRKTRHWLDAHGVAYHFHDYRKDGIDAALCATLLQALPLATLINTRGTTWRALPEETRLALSMVTAPALMQSAPALIRRPLLQTRTGWLSSADPSVLATLLEHS
jgi:arsenate reductase